MNTYRSQGQTNYVKQQKENKKEGEGVSARCKYVEAKESGWGAANCRDEIKREKMRSPREGKDIGDYLLTNISKHGIISCRFLSFFPISPEA